jgi:DnaJ-domain-containing protein 1
MLLDRLIRLIKANMTSGRLADPPKDIFETYTIPEEEYRQSPPPPPKTPPVFDTTEAKYYAALELPAGSSFEEIKKAYKQLLKKYHPDRFHNEPNKQRYAEQVAQRLNEAYAYFKKKFGK